MKLSVAEFRKNMREAFNAAESGEYVFITRHDKWFKLISFEGEVLSDKAQAVIDKMSTPSITPEKNEPVATQQNEFVEALDAVEQKCCRLKSPCKHWQFNDGVWINSLSGRTREVE